MPRTKNLDLPQGIIWKQLLLFLLPIAAGTLFQQFYSTVDAIVVGRFLGSDALAAVGGSAAVIVQLVVGIFTGLSSGATVVISHGYGADDQEKLTRAVHTSIAFSLLGGIVITVVGILLTPQSLVWLKNPQEIMADATLYLRWYFVGTIPMLLFNMGSGILRAVGDSKRPLYYLMLCCLLNIVLDPVFIFVFGMGVSGAALATILSQAVSAAWVLRFLFSAKSGIRIRRGNMKFEKRVVGKVIGLGIAPFIMQSTESLVNITLNAGLQRYGGDLYVGSMTIMQSVMQMLVMPIQGITQGAQPIMSYNYGAKNYSRVRKTFSLLLKVMLLVTVSGFALAALLPGVLARMFTQDAELIEIVKKMMPIFFGGIWAFGAQMACQTTFMALGQAKISLFLALLRKVVLLVPLALLLPVVMGGNVLGIYIAEPVADVIASFTTLSLFLIKRKTLLPDGGAPAKSK